MDLNQGDAFFSSFHFFSIVDWKGKLLLNKNSPVSFAERLNRPFIVLGISFVYNTNKTGPNTDPSGQEIYRPGTAISDASNLCTEVGGDQNKEFRGKTSIMREGG